jgi:hypothetical protein
MNIEPCIFLIETHFVGYKIVINIFMVNFDEILLVIQIIT